MIGTNEGGWISINDWSQLASYTTVQGTSVQITGNGISPQLYFKYVKSKLGILAKRKFEGRLKQLERAFDEFIEQGHEAMAKKTLETIVRETRYAEIESSGVKYVIDSSAITKHKNSIKGGHISNTSLENFTRPIPTNILNRIKELKKAKVFDEYTVYHYFNEKLEEKKEKKEPITPSERSAMRDPVLFGSCREIPGKMFFIADWEDEYCDLTFDDIICSIDKRKRDMTIPKVGSELSDLT